MIGYTIRSEAMQPNLKVHITSTPTSLSHIKILN